MTDLEKTESTSGNTTRFISLMILVLFLCSGMTGLLYEVIWSRMIVKVIGAAPFAISIVLTVFMGGLGLGSYLAGRYIDQIKKSSQLLQLYGLMEIGIGIYAFVLKGVIAASQPIFSSIYNQSSEHLLIFNAVILLGAFVLFIFPVTLMGATLPILIRFYVANLGHLGARVGRLYAINTIGAAVGSILSGFLLINLWGVDGTLRFAVVINFLIGGISFVLANWVAKRSSLDEQKADRHAVEVSQTAVGAQYSRSHQLAVLAIFAVSGYAAMAYEVIWTRLLGLIIGPTTYSFTIVLTTFIVGLALGAMFFGWLADRSKHPFRLLLITQMSAAILALVVSQFLGNSQFFFAKLIFSFRDDFVMLYIAKATLLFLLLLGPTLALGATFPLVGKIYTSSIRKLGKSIGFAYAINTIGALLGAFSAGFVLIPLFGKENSLSLVIGIQLLTVLAIVGLLYPKGENSRIRLILLSSGILGLLLTFAFPHWDREQLATGKYYRFSSYADMLKNTSWWDALVKMPRDFMPNISGTEVVFYGDGIGGFTTVEQDIDPLGKPQYVLYNSGKADASSESDMATQTMLAHLPLLFHPQPKNVMILGLASGVTAGEALYYDLDRLDILEISEQVVEASDFFRETNSDVLSHPATNLIIQDGRAHLELTEQVYDVITSEPSNPWMAGLANLFTEEFFRLTKNRLSWDGVFIQWLPSYQMDWTTFSMIGRTFTKVFPNSLLMKSFIGGNDYLLVGFNGLKQLDLENGLKNLPKLQKSPNLIVEDPRILYRLIVSDNLPALFGSGPGHTDDHPVLEFMAPQRMHLVDKTIEKTLAARRTLGDEIIDVMREVLDVDGQLKFARFMLSVYSPFQDMVDLSTATEEQKVEYTEMLMEYSKRNAVQDYDMFESMGLRDTVIQTQIAQLTQKLPSLPNRLASFFILANAHAELGDFDEAIKYCRQIIEMGSDPIEANLNLGLFCMNAGRNEEAIAAYNTVLELDPEHSHAHNNLGTLFEQTGETKNAKASYEQAVLIDPDLAIAHFNLARLHMSSGAVDSAMLAYATVLKLDPEYVPAYYRVSQIYQISGDYEKAIAIMETLLKIRPDLKEAQIEIKNLTMQMEQEQPKVSVQMPPRTAKSDKSTDPRYFYNQAVMLIQKQKYREAIVDFERALSLKPDYLNALIGLGAMYQNLSEYEAAISQYKRALAIDPNHSGTHNNMAINYYTVKKYKLAIEHADKAKALGFKVQQAFLDELSKYR
ncbi:MAG: fused MFS/spermidine synthase [Candidatus Marinimicrobia bacterium]|nr:fused MFS/spermidine synthase [Candidatus Neomarinimicrobiota bacterium]